MKTIITLLLIIRNPIYCIWHLNGGWHAAAWAAQSGWASLLQGVPNAIDEACEDARRYAEEERAEILAEEEFYATLSEQIDQRIAEDKAAEERDWKVWEGSWSQDDELASARW